jgi:hypothetical protein
MARVLNVCLILSVLLALCLVAIPVQAAATPSVTWLTFMESGSSFGQGAAIAVDGSGNIYVAGRVDRTWGSPVRAYAAYDDAFVVKLNNSGQVLWSTFLGGSGFDFAAAIALDNSGYVYVAGSSSASWGSPKRPFASGSGYDAFAARLSAASGALDWNTFLGGASDDMGRGLDFRGTNVYVCGYSMAAWGSPVRSFTDGSTDAFVTRLDAGSGTQGWLTFLGGSAADFASAVTADSSNVYVCGYSFATWESPLQTFTGAPVMSSDGFAARLNADTGVLGWNTFMGCADYDFCYCLAQDNSGNIYIGGRSSATWGPPVRPFSGNGDGFVARLNFSGARIWNTFLGSSGGGADESCTGIAADNAGNIYAAGITMLGVSWGSPWSAINPSSLYNGFVAMVDNSGGLVSNGFHGGLTAIPYGLAMDCDKNIYVSGSTTDGWGNPLNAFEPNDDAYVLKINDPALASCPSGPSTVSLNTTLGTVNLNTSAGYFSGPGWVPTANIRCSSPAGFFFPYGMFSFNIGGLTAGQSARVTLRFPNPLPAGVKYYKCINGRTIDCSSIMTRIDPYTLQLTLTDGGLGDSDGAANGTIADPGGPAFPLNNAPQSSSPTMPAAPQKPVSLSNVTVKSASLSATRVTPDAPVTVTANVANTGTGNGTANIKVYVNGAEESQQGVTVNSGGTSTVTFDVTRNEPGTYTVYVGGTPAGSFTVDQFTPDTILYISAALIFFALIGGVIFMTRRRA